MPRKWLGTVRDVGGILLLCIAAAARAQAPTVVDSFDGTTLGSNWETSRLVAGAVSLQSEIVRRGRSAVKITLRPNDVFEAGRNGNADSERDELLEARRLVSLEGVSYESSWSMYLPADFPIVPVRLVVAQWKQFCGGEGKPCDDDSPVLAVRYVGGILRITQDVEHRTRVLYEERRDLRSKWLDLRFRTCFTPNSTGRIRAWLDDVPVVDFTGATANPQTAATGYSRPGRFYFKMGLYRNVMPEPMTIYLDEYSKRQLPSGGER